MFILYCLCYESEIMFVFSIMFFFKKKNNFQRLSQPCKCLYLFNRMKSDTFRGNETSKQARFYIFAPFTSFHKFYYSFWFFITCVLTICIWLGCLLKPKTRITARKKKNLPWSFWWLQLLPKNFRSVFGFEKSIFGLWITSSI